MVDGERVAVIGTLWPEAVRRPSFAFGYRLACVAAVLCFVVGPVSANVSEPLANAAKVQQSKPVPDERGTKKLPAVIGLSAAPVLRVESTDKTVRLSDYRSPEWVLAYCTATLALITAALALYTFRLYRATVGLGRDAKVSAEQQSGRMERSITEANRAAVAMEAVARATTNNATLMQTLLTKQMRAYVSVDLGQSTYQDANLRFAVRPTITNNGLTPARNVSFKVLAGIIDGTSPETITFPPIGDLIVNDIGLAPRQSFTISAVLNHRVPDADVSTIMQGNTRKLFAWGRVTYDDVYGGSWETNFCFSYTFFTDADGKVIVNGFYFPRNNSAT
jgi:hypothetical protein